MLEKTRQLFDRLVLHSLPTVEYVGTEGYTAFRQAVCERFAEADQKENANLSLPSGWDSAAIITSAARRQPFYAFWQPLGYQLRLLR